MKNKETKKEVQCLTCGYSWKTKSEKIYVNCPSCRTSVKINELKKVKENGLQK